MRKCKCGAECNNRGRYPICDACKKLPAPAVAIANPEPKQEAPATGEINNE
jgi:hypothetical protein